MSATKWKAAKVALLVVLDLSILATIVVSIAEGGDPTVVPIVGLIVVGLISGMEVTEFVAVYSAVKERQYEERTGGNDSDA